MRDNSTPLWVIASVLTGMFVFMMVSSLDLSGVDFEGIAVELRSDLSVLANVLGVSILAMAGLFAVRLLVKGVSYLPRFKGKRS